MKGLITDRTQRNVYYRKELPNKGWARMTTEERTAWLGNPLEAEGANLFACGPAYSEVVSLKYRSEEIVATAMVAGTHLFSVLLSKQSFTLAKEPFHEQETSLYPLGYSVYSLRRIIFYSRIQQRDPFPDESSGDSFFPSRRHFADGCKKGKG